MDVVPVRISVLVRVVLWVYAVLQVGNLMALWLWHETGRDYAMGFVPFHLFEMESNFPTWFQVVLLLITSLMLWVCSYSIFGGNNRMDLLRIRVLAILFLLLSLDELAMVHEKLVPVVGTILPQQGVLYYGWVVPGVLLFAGVGLFMLPLLLRLEKDLLCHFIAGGILFVVGAVGMEIVSGLIAQDVGEANWSYSLLSTVEETLENFGVLVFLRGLLRSMANKTSGVCLVVQHA